jgi:hypothetical protein
MMLEWNLGWESVDWMHVAQDGISDGLLWTRYWIFGFHKRRQISWLAE